MLIARNYSTLFDFLTLLFDIISENSYQKQLSNKINLFILYVKFYLILNTTIKFWKIYIIIKSLLCPRYITQNRVIKAESKVLMVISEYCHETSHTKLRRAWMRQEKWSCRLCMRSPVTLPRNFRGKCAIRKFNDNYNLHETNSHTILTYVLVFKRIVNTLYRRNNVYLYTYILSLKNFRIFYL